MKKIAFMAACFFMAASCRAQLTELQEKIPYQYGGLEYGYYIAGEQSKDVKGDDMERFELVLYVSNKTNSIRILPFNSTDNVQDERPIAEFSCRNATGKRLTSKNGKVSAKPCFAQVRIPDDTQASKFRFVKAQIGYALKPGETLSTKIIVIVPKGEKPLVSCKAVDYTLNVN